MEKRYTLPVAIALVVGTVIGSGVFFKAEAVLTKTGGNLSVGILAFIIMGVVMIISACTFGVVAQSHEGVEGLVGYAAASCGKTYSYYVGWFMAVIYYPSLVSVLSWLPARYFGVLMGWDDPVVGGRTMMLAGVFMVVTYTMNALAPKLAGKFAIATTIIKLIPLLLMAVVGTIVGLTSGMTEFNFSNVVTEMPFTEGLFGAIVSLAFAFEGWICATSIGTELKDSKKNMPRALLIGTVIVAIVYVIYYVGLAGAVESEVMMAGGEAGAKIAFQNIFGQVGGAAIFVFVVISCWGTCNGLTMAVPAACSIWPSRATAPSWPCSRTWTPTPTWPTTPLCSACWSVPCGCCTSTAAPSWRASVPSSSTPPSCPSSPCTPSTSPSTSP